MSRFFTSLLLHVQESIFSELCYKYAEIHHTGLDFLLNHFRGTTFFYREILKNTLQPVGYVLLMYNSCQT